jgi:hypothetical protein
MGPGSVVEWSGGHMQKAAKICSGYSLMGANLKTSVVDNRIGKHKFYEWFRL